MKRSVLEQHDSLAVADFASIDTLERVLDRKLDDLDVLVFVYISAAGRNTVPRLVSSSAPGRRHAAEGPRAARAR